jgi:hypothetical protein
VLDPAHFNDYGESYQYRNAIRFVDTCGLFVIEVDDSYQMDDWSEQVFYLPKIPITPRANNI